PHIYFTSLYSFPHSFLYTTVVVYIINIFLFMYTSHIHITLLFSFLLDIQSLEWS
ncbi:hypothetical protein ACJX0J_018650, partial [Zea mays]